MQVFLTVLISRAKTQGWLLDIWVHIMIVTHISKANPLRSRQRIINLFIAHPDPEPMPDGTKPVIPAYYLIRAIGVKEALSKEEQDSMV